MLRGRRRRLAGWRRRFRGGLRRLRGLLVPVSVSILMAERWPFLLLNKWRRLLHATFPPRSSTQRSSSQVTSPQINSAQRNSTQRNATDSNRTRLNPQRKLALTLADHILHHILTPRAMPHKHNLPPRPQAAEIPHTLGELLDVFLQRTGAPPAVGGGEQDFCDGPVCRQTLGYRRGVSGGWVSGVGCVRGWMWRWYEEGGALGGKAKERYGAKDGEKGKERKARP
jgi:hypothetical protein